MIYLDVLTEYCSLETTRAAHTINTEWNPSLLFNILAGLSQAISLLCTKGERRQAQSKTKKMSPKFDGQTVFTIVTSSHVW